MKKTPSSGASLRLRQALGLSTNNPHLVRLIHTHPEVSIHLRGQPDLENEGTEDQAEFTNLTKIAVVKFQQQKGIRADGIVDIKTWRALGHDPVLLRQWAQGGRRGGLEGIPGIEPPTEMHTGGLDGCQGFGPRAGRGLPGDPGPGPRPRGGLDGTAGQGPRS